MNNDTQSIFITGVGGQGIILASEILSEAALVAGHDIKKSEVHGMAQRGGTVVSAVRFGEKIYSPLITEGKADVVLAFEKLEALRQIEFLKQGGTMIVNTQTINPGPVASGEMQYPRDIIARIEQSGVDAKFIDGLTLAKQAGHPRSTNVVLLGALSNFLPLEEKVCEQAIKARVPGKTIEINLKAFELGKNSL